MDSDKLDLNFLIGETEKYHNRGSGEILADSDVRFEQTSEPVVAHNLVDLSLLFSDQAHDPELAVESKIDYKSKVNSESDEASPPGPGSAQFEFDINDEALELLKDLEFESEEDINVKQDSNDLKQPLNQQRDEVENRDCNLTTSDESVEFEFLSDEIEAPLILTNEPSENECIQDKIKTDENNETDTIEFDFEFDDSEIAASLTRDDQPEDTTATSSAAEMEVESVDLLTHPETIDDDEETVFHEDSENLHAEISQPASEVNQDIDNDDPLEISQKPDSNKENKEPFFLTKNEKINNKQDYREPGISIQKNRVSPETARNKKYQKPGFMSTMFSLVSLFENTKLVGLDLGTTSLKYVIINRTARGVKLIDCGMRPIPKLPIEATEEDKIAAIVEILLNKFKISSLKNILITSAISGLEVLYQNIQIPKMSQKELLKSVPWACRKDFPFPIENTVFEFQVIDKKNNKPDDKLDIFVQAVQKDLVKKHLENLSRAGIVPAKVSTIPVALWKLFTTLVKNITETCIVIIDIGGNSSHLVFINHGKLLFAREISTAGADITEALTGSIFIQGKEINISAEKAENIKRKYGLINNFQDDEKEENIPLKEISVMMGPVLEKLVNEIQRTMDFFKEKFKVDILEKIYITGGGAFLNKLSTYLANELNTDVELLNPFHFLSSKNIMNRPELEEIGPRLAVAAGLALDKGRKLNFLPDELKGAHTFQYLKRIVRYLFLIIILLMILMSQNIKSQINKIETEFKRVQAEYNMSKPKRARFIQLQNEILHLTKENEIYKNEIEINLKSTNHLKTISHLVPSNIALTALNIENRKIEKEQIEQELLILDGVAFQNNSLEGINLAKFLLALEKANYFSAIYLKNQRIREDGNLEFTIECIN